MNLPIATRAVSAGLIVCLSLGFMPLGCGSGQEGAIEPTSGIDEGPTVPEATVAQLTSCAKQGVARLAETHYAIVFDADVTESGDAHEVRVRDTMIHDGGIESCMLRALRAMSVPGAVTAIRVRHRVSDGRLSPESRTSMGNVLVLGGAVNLVPILIVAAGVTIIVAVVIHAVSKTSTRDPTAEESEQQRCKKVKQGCIDYCSDTTLPTPDFGWRFQSCKNDCIEKQGCPRDS